MFTVFHFREQSLPHEGKLNKDRQWSRLQHCRMLLFMLPIMHTCTANTPTHTYMECTSSWHRHTHVCGDTQTHTLSIRQQGPVSDHGGAWICSVVRANDLRHMSSPCGFKTKHCQERSALARAACALLCCALLCSACGGRYNPPSPRRNSSSSFHIGLFFAPTDCCRLCVCCCSHLSGCRRFACEARDGATTPRRLSPFTLPTVGEAACWARDGKEGGKKGRKTVRKKVCLYACEERRIELAEEQRLWKVSNRTYVSREKTFSDANMLDMLMGTLILESDANSTLSHENMITHLLLISAKKVYSFKISNKSFKVCSPDSNNQLISCIRVKMCLFFCYTPHLIIFR